MLANHSYTPVTTVDACGHPCPTPVVMARRHVQRIGAGEVLLVIADCIRAADELSTWARVTGNELLQVEALDGRRKAHYIRKGRRHAVHNTVDTRGSRCPTPVIEAGRALRALRSGGVIRLISDCPSARTEIEAWTRNTGHALLDAVEDFHGDLYCDVQRH